MHITVGLHTVTCSVCYILRAFIAAVLAFMAAAPCCQQRILQGLQGG